MFKSGYSAHDLRVVLLKYNEDLKEGVGLQSRIETKTNRQHWVYTYRNTIGDNIIYITIIHREIGSNGRVCQSPILKRREYNITMFPGIIIPLKAV